MTTGGVERALIQGDKAAFGSPSWSPESASLAVIGNWHAIAVGPHDEHLWVVPAGGGEPRCVSEGFKRSLEDSTGGDMFVGSDTRPVWTPDGATILAIASDAGATHIHAFNADGSGSRQITSGAKRHSTVTISPDGKQIAYLVQTATSPGDLFVSDLNGKKERRLTSLNDDSLGKLHAAGTGGVHDRIAC